MHGVATATVAARFGLDCVIYMGTTDIERQQANVFRMKLLGAEVIPVVAGTGTLKDAMNEALRDWVTNVDDTFYLIGTVAGPHPYPAMVRDFQAVIGKETRDQLQAQEGRLPDSLVACIGGVFQPVARLAHQVEADVHQRQFFFQQRAGCAARPGCGAGRGGEGIHHGRVAGEQWGAGCGGAEDRDF